MKKTALFIIFFGLSINLFSQSKNMDSLIKNYAKNNNFNGTIIVQKNSSIVYHHSFGSANRQFEIPNSNVTKYHIASITKLFTAVLILRLHEIGKIDLDQPIKTYLPNYKGEGVEKVTIHQLLNHTSGIENCEEIGSDVEIYRMPNTIDNIITKYCSGKLRWEPGTKFSYNNSEYIILGKIIEELYKKSYEQVLSEMILQPLSMKNSGFAIQSKVIKNLAYSYWRDDKTKEYKNNPPLLIENYHASAAIYSTASDLLKFSNGVFGGKLLTPSSLKLLLTTTLESENYGCGLWIKSLTINKKALPVAQRTGLIWGSSSLLTHYLNRNLTIIFVANTNITDLYHFNQIITELLME